MVAREALVPLYRSVFCRRAFFRFNQALHELSLHGIGVLNYEDTRVSGERAVLRRLAQIRTTPTIFDVGAHAGEYAREVREEVPGARIYAFEPHPETFERLRVGAADNAYIPVHAAVGAQSETVVIYDEGVGKGTQLASIVPGVIEVIHGKPESQSHQVPCVSIDDFLSENQIEHVDFLKIDAEGAERDILVGASVALAGSAIDLIQIEFNEMNVISRVFLRDLLDLLSTYTAFRLLPDGPVALGRYAAKRHEIFAFQNILFVSGRFEEAAKRVMTS
jgi:FkbM family methyltransferase